MSRNGQAEWPWAHHPPPPYPYLPPQAASGNGNGRDLTKATLPVLVVIGIVITTAAGAFGVGKSYEANQSRLDKIEARISGVEEQLRAIDGSLKQLAKRDPWPDVTTMHRN